MSKTRHKYHDDWIIEHYNPNKKWSSILQEYNKSFGVNIPYPTFVSHMNRELHLQMDRDVYTKEEDDFLRQYYPHYGYIETAKLYNEHFGKNRSALAIEGRCHVLKCHVTKERRSAMCPENHHRTVPIGSVRDWGCHGEIVVKTENGWVNAKELVVEKKPGMFIVHLDGDVKNNKKENLFHVTRNEIGIMATNHFWSEQPEITKTGILWSRLYILLKNAGIVKEEYEENFATETTS